METKILTCCEQTTVKNWWNLLISNPKPDLYNISVHTKFSENPLKFTKIIVLKRKNQMCHGHTLSKIDEICPLANPKIDLHNNNTHTKLGENPLTLTQVIVWKWKYGWTVVRQVGHTDGDTDDQLETIIPSNYPVPGYKKHVVDTH